MENLSDFIEFRIDTDKKLLYGKWLRNVTSTEYKAGLQEVGKLLNQYDMKLWLQNSEKLEPLNINDQKWLTEQFGILLIQFPLQYIAVVTPRNSAHFAELLAVREKAYRIFGKSKHVEVFETEEEALAWLIPNMQYYRLPATTYKANTPQAQ